MFRKIAFLGSDGSGKSTIVRSLGQCSPLPTELPSSINLSKELRTVGIDFAQISLDEETHLGLYGLPDPKKLSLVLEFVKHGLWAIVILIKNNDQRSIDELGALIEYFNITEKLPCVIAVTHVDESRKKITFVKIKKKLKAYGLQIPVFSTDAREFSSAGLLLNTIVAIDECMHS